MIKAIIFDFGGIFNVGKLKDALKDIATKCNINPEEFDEFTLSHWDESKLQKESSFISKCADHLNITSNDFIKQLIDQFVFQDDVLAFANQLKDRYTLAILTNNIAQWFEDLRKTHALDDIFKVIVTSYDEGVAKPDPEIYKRTVQKLGVQANECVFIDDWKGNLIPAEELGMKTVLFRNLDQLKEDLKKFGVEC